MKPILDFLTDLQANNNREWFTENKNRYNHARKTFDDFVNRLIAGINKFDPEVGMLTAKDCVFRIYRDVRFSRDKSPYKTNMGGFIAKGGRKGGNAGYYIHIEPGGSFVAGGNYMPPADRLYKIRQEIMYNIKEFRSIIENPGFKKAFGQLEGEKLTRPPKDFPADFPEIDLLKFKSYIVSHPLADKMVLQPDFDQHVLSAFRELQPLSRFLNKAVD